MFFRKKEKNEEKKYFKRQIRSRQFCQTFSSVITPNLYKGTSLQESWKKTRWLFLNTIEKDVFEEMLEQEFSLYAIEQVFLEYRDSDYGGFKALFHFLHHLQNETPDVIGDMLTLFDIHIQTPLRDPDCYTGEKLYEYVDFLLSQRT